MKITYGRVALATVLAGFIFTITASADTLELSANQPTISGSLDSGLEGQAKAGPATGGKAVYIVQLGDPALATYNGGIGNMKATSNRKTGNRRLNVNSKESKAYTRYLKKLQKEMVAESAVALGHDLDVRYNYQAVFNGVAMVLTEEEANVVAAAPGVKNVSRERIEVPLTDVGPQFIGAPSIWTGPPNNVDHSRGEGIVIAVLDTGINHDHPSYADIGGDGFDHSNPLGSGNFIPGSYCDAVDPTFCNDKLIGAWSFVPGDANFPVPEDSDGHGSHTSSTAGGNFVLPATLFAPTTQVSRDISGVAPHANIIMYDVCIDTCPGSALLAAINQVVVDASNLPDGIHSLNYSISGGGNPYNDAVEIGFLNATAAGVYVSASAGNSGPAPATVAHLGPWVSTTAASTHNRTVVNSLVDLSSDADPLADIIGAGFTSGFGPATIINSADLEDDFPGSTVCGLGELGDFDSPWPTDTFDGEIVACTRGTFGRVEKGANVLFAGAGGYILMDNGSGIVGDAHVLPGVHITQADGAVLAAWLAANPNPTGSITEFTINLDASNGDIMAGFSSRGPNNAFGVLKPDVSAPGVSIFAAEADGQAPPPEYQFLSGTSMSSPHNAGSGALLSAVQPDWTPYQIKSALMMTSTTANTLKEDGVTPTDHFDVGAGRIDLSNAPNAGLVLDETPANFLAADPATGGDPTTLNLASMQDNACVEACSWTRTVENVTGGHAQWELSTTGPAGLELATDPGKNNLKLGPGESKTITVTANTALAPQGWNFATLELERQGDGPDLHMPIAVFASNSSNPDLLSKTVDAATAAKGEPLNYQISITNGQVDGMIRLSDALPEGLEFVKGSETAVVTKGITRQPFANRGGTLKWSGTLELSTLGIGVSGGPPFGYFPLRFLGVPPSACPSNCDDGGFILDVPTFEFNGDTYDQVIWSINGTVEAGISSLQATSFFNRDMPDPALPNNLLAPLWTDFGDFSTDPDGLAEWYVANLSAGPFTFTVYEWNNVYLFGDPSTRYAFQIWVQRAPTPVIYFIYARVDNPLIFGTVGVENASGSDGEAFYFNGSGTLIGAGLSLEILSVPGGTATFGFQAVVEDCKAGDAIVNRVNLSGATDETAIAVTQCVE